MPRFDPERFRPFPGPHYGGAGVLHFVVMGLLLAAAVVLILWAVTQMRHHHAPAATFAPPASPAAASDAALREVRLRYARGEMTREEFLQVSSDLGDLVAASVAPPLARPSASDTPSATAPGDVEQG